MKRKFDIVTMPPEINYVVKSHKFYLEQYNIAIKNMNVEMTIYYSEKVSTCERQIAANLYQYIY